MFDLSANEAKVVEYMKSLGLANDPNFKDIDGAANYRHISVQHMGVNVNVFLDRQFIAVDVRFAYAPKMNVAPFFRRLLALNSMLYTAKFGLIDQTGQIVITTSRVFEGLDLVEFKALLDSVVTVYWQHATNLVNEFQLPQQP